MRRRTGFTGVQSLHAKKSPIDHSYCLAGEKSGDNDKVFNYQDNRGLKFPECNKAGIGDKVLLRVHLERRVLEPLKTCQGQPVEDSGGKGEDNKLASSPPSSQG